MATWNYGTSNVNDIIKFNGAQYTGRRDNGQTIFDSTDNIHASDLTHVEGLLKQLQDKLRQTHGDQMLQSNDLDQLPEIKSVVEQLSRSTSNLTKIFNGPVDSTGTIQIQFNNYMYKARVDKNQTVYDVVSASPDISLAQLITRINTLLHESKQATVEITQVEYL